MSLRHGLQEGVQRLGKVMQELRVDNSSAATHRLGAGRERGFNPEFVSVCEHYGVTPKTIGRRTTITLPLPLPHSKMLPRLRGDKKLLFPVSLRVFSRS